MSFLHARTFETRWGIGLAFIDLDDETDCEVLRLQLWAPIAEDGSEAKVALKVGLNSEASDEAQDLMAAANREALANMDADRFEKVFASAGVAQLLDEACGTTPETADA